MTLAAADARDAGSRVIVARVTRGTDTSFFRVHLHSWVGGISLRSKGISLRSKGISLRSIRKDPSSRRPWRSASRDTPGPACSHSCRSIPAPTDG